MVHMGYKTSTSHYTLISFYFEGTFSSTVVVVDLNSLLAVETVNCDWRV